MSQSSFFKSGIEGNGEEEEDEEEEQNISHTSVGEDSSLKEGHGIAAAKASNQPPYLHVPLQSAFARSSDTLSNLSTYSADNENERRTGRLLTVSSSRRLPSSSPAPSPRTWKETTRLFWTRNKGLTLVVLSQLFGVMMNVTIRLLEMSGSAGPGMHPFQVRPAVPLAFPSDTLGAKPYSAMTDPIRSHDRDPHPQQHLSMVG